MRLWQTRAVRQECWIKVPSESIQHLIHVVPNRAQCSQNHAWQETLDHVGKIGDELVGQRLLVDDGTRLYTRPGFPYTTIRQARKSMALPLPSPATTA